MTLADAIAMIQPMEFSNESQRWADLGCGSGLFSLALASLLPEGSYLLCVDKYDQAIEPGNIEGVSLEFQKADFSEYPFESEKFDGYLMANSLHYIKDQPELLSKLMKTLRPNGRVIIIEYDTEMANLWVPYPLTYRKLEALSWKLGATQIRKIYETQSVFGSMMYSSEIKR